ncbi:MAG: MarR family winged helix-turn-helix transcriptional regulator [Thermoanaerobaculia bacterium]
MSGSPTEKQLRDLEGCVCLALRRAMRAVTQAYDTALRPLGVRVTQLPILTAVASHGRVPLAPLAEELGMDRTTLIRNVRPLERDGLVEQGVEEGSRRTELRATAKGRAILARAYPVWRRVQERASSRLPDPDWRAKLHDLEIAMQGISGDA